MFSTVTCLFSSIPFDIKELLETIVLIFDLISIIVAFIKWIRGSKTASSAKKQKRDGQHKGHGKGRGKGKSDVHKKNKKKKRR